MEGLRTQKSPEQTKQFKHSFDIIFFLIFDFTVDFNTLCILNNRQKCYNILSFLTFVLHINYNNGDTKTHIENQYFIIFKYKQTIN